MTHPTYHNLIGGQWVPGRRRQNLPQPQPRRPLRRRRRVPRLRTPKTSTVPSPPPGRPLRPGVSFPRPNAPKSSYRAGRSSSRTQGKIRPRHDPRNGQSARRNPRRRPGGHRRSLLRGRRRPTPLRRHHPQSSCPTNSPCPSACPSASVGLITPWNFPMAIPSWKLFPALVAGNTCVIKPADGHAALHLQPGPGARRSRPSAGRRQHRLRLRLLRPARRSSSTPASAPSASPARAKSARSSASAPPPPSSPVSLEMGGKNAQIVLDDANLDLALDGALWGAFGTTGQRCTATSRILSAEGNCRGVHRKVRRTRQPAQSRQRPRRIRRSRPAGQPPADRNLINATSKSQKGRREASHRRQRAHRWRLRQRNLLRAHRLRRRHTRTCASPAKKSSALWSASSNFRLRRSRRHRQRHRLRPLHRALHPRRQPRLRRHARPRSRHHLHQRAHHRRRSPSALRRSQANRQRPSRRRSAPSTSSPPGKPSTSTTPTNSSAPKSTRGSNPSVVGLFEFCWGLIPVAGLLHRNQTPCPTRTRLIRSVYGRAQPPAAPQSF